MNRRTFLKALAVSPLAPAVLLCAKEKKASLFYGDLYCGEVNENEWHKHKGGEWHIRLQNTGEDIKVY